MNLLLDQQEAKSIANQYQFLITQKLGFMPYIDAIIYTIEPILEADDDYKVIVKSVNKVPEMMPELTQETEYKQVEIDLFDLIFIQRLPVLFDLDDLVLATE